MEPKIIYKIFELKNAAEAFTYKVASLDGVPGLGYSNREQAVKWINDSGERGKNYFILEIFYKP